jgi:hypothetical protein
MLAPKGTLVHLPREFARRRQPRPPGSPGESGDRLQVVAEVLRIEREPDIRSQPYSCWVRLTNGKV